MNHDAAQTFQENQLASLWRRTVCFSLVVCAAVAVTGSFAHAQKLAPKPISGAHSTLHPPNLGPAHPAVVRIFASDSKGLSVGSGTLVDTRDRVGLVVTNWHVIREATGSITVAFPDGFRSTARVIQSDQTWDLAALSIWRPRVSPVRISSAMPVLGEPLTIAGFGSDGVFRAASGACTQYMSPAQGEPNEIVEVGIAARQGDSGGPMFNQRGELAGVLFGSVDRTTSGSYGGRVAKFLEPLLSGSKSVDVPVATGIAVSQISSTTANAVSFDDQLKAKRPAESTARTVSPLEQVAETAVADSERLRIVHTPLTNTLPGFESFANGAVDSSESVASAWSMQAFVGHTPIEQAKAALAIVGLLALTMVAMRIGRSAPESAKK